MPKIWCCTELMERLLLLVLPSMHWCDCGWMLETCGCAVLMMMLLLQLASIQRSGSGTMLTIWCWAALMLLVLVHRSDCGWTLAV